MPQTWYTSDTHFSHNNILKHESRPFASVEEMNEFLIETWNKTVSNNDIIFHLGDFAFGGTTKWESILSRLKGNINLILGNHDDKKVLKKVAYHFDSIETMVEKVIDKQHLFLFHYPIEIGLTPNAYSIHGHIHGRVSNHINQINVGVDSPFISRTVGFGNLIPEEYLLRELVVVKEKVLELRSAGRG